MQPILTAIPEFDGTDRKIIIATTPAGLVAVGSIMFVDYPPYLKIRRARDYWALNCFGRDFTNTEHLFPTPGAAIEWANANLGSELKAITS